LDKFGVQSGVDKPLPFVKTLPFSFPNQNFEIKNQKFGPKSKFLLKNHNFGPKSEILEKI